MLCYKVIIAVVLFFCFYAKPLQAQQYTSEGSEFYLSFVPNTISASYEIIFSSKTNNTVTVENSKLGYSKSYNLQANIPFTATVPIDFCAAKTNEDAVFKSLHIVAAKPLSVYAVNAASFSSDATLVLPVTIFSYEYYVCAYEAASQGAPSTFIIVATEDSSAIQITPSAETSGKKPAGIPFTVFLMKNQAYRVSTEADITGTHIISLNSKKFAVFSGNVCAVIPRTCAACDVIMEQVIPTDRWGKKFIIAPLSTPTIPTQYTYKIIASRDSTAVNVNGFPFLTLKKGKSVTLNNQLQALCIETSKPVMVVQYTEGEGCAGIGDPSMVIIPPLEQFINKVNYTTPSFSGFTSHYGCVIIKNGAKSRIKLNGSPITPSSFKPLATFPDYCYANISLINGNNMVECDSGFIMVAYGYGSYISYSFIGGSNFKNLSYGAGYSEEKCGVLNFDFFNTGDIEKVSLSIWEFEDGSTDTGLRINKSFNNYGKHKVKNRSLMLSSFGKDTVKIEIEVDAKAAPKANFLINDSLQCINGNLFEFTDISTDNHSELESRAWRFINSSANDTSRVVKKVFNQPLTTKVELKVTNEDGCSDSIIKSIIISPEPKIDININDSVQCLKNHNFIITDNSVIDSPWTIDYQWIFSDGVEIKQKNIPDRKFDAPGKYKLTAILKTSGNCIDSLEKPLTVNFSPVIDYMPDSVCLGQYTNFNNRTHDPKNEITFWKWDFGNGNSSSDRHPAYIYSDTGKYNVTVMAATSEGCGDTLEIPQVVAVYPTPLAKFVYSDSANYYFYFVSYSSKLVNHLWDFGDNATSGGLNSKHIYKKPGSYTVKLTVTDSNNCTSQYDTVVVVYQDELFVPNAFTPGNNDLLNDLFKIHVNEYMLKYELRIYNRWGEELFVSYHPDNGWDGSYNGVPLPDGVYMYVINVTYPGNKINKAGTFHLLR